MTTCITLAIAGCGPGDPVAQSTGGGFGSTSGPGGFATASSGSYITTGSYGGHIQPQPVPDPCLPQPNPELIPDGWAETLDWSCKCRFYEPQSKEALPPPIQWEPCPDGGDGVVCQAMALNWAGEDSKIAANPSMDHNPDGSAALQFVRFVGKKYSLHLVADADGPVRTAMYFLWGGKNWQELTCRPHDQRINEGTFLTHLSGQDTENWVDYQGARGGNIDDLHPPVIAKYDSTDAAWQHAWVPGASGVVRLAKGILSFFPWNMTSETFITSASVDPEGLRSSNVVVRNEGVFWETSTLHRTGINSWDKFGNARPLIRWPHDTTRGAGNFGTDGIDMVWCQGEGKAPNEKIFPIRSIMTAPFTTDPAKLQPRRVRSLPTERVTAVTSAQVGCGHALLEGPAGDLIVTRLSDGWMWYVPQMPDRSIKMPLGMTCTELFAGAIISGKINIARIRLDSLGPGFPPD